MEDRGLDKDLKYTGRDDVFDGYDDFDDIGDRRGLVSDFEETLVEMMFEDDERWEL